MSPIFEWLVGEAGAGWIVGLLGVIVGIFFFLKNKEHPPRIIIQEIRRIRLLDIHPSQSESLKVLFTDANGVEQSINNLEQREFAVYNNGTLDVLEPLDFSLRLTQKVVREDDKLYQKYLKYLIRMLGIDQGSGSSVIKPLDLDESHFQQWTFDNPACSISPIKGDSKIGEQLFQFKLPYLNSYPVHQHCEILRLISNGEYVYELNTKVGRGWSAYFISLWSLYAVLLKMRIVLRLMSVFILLLIMLFLIAYYHKVKLSEIKWRIGAGNYLAKIKLLELQENI